MASSFREKRLLYRVETKHDQHAFAELYDTFVDRIYRFVALKVVHKEEAEDVTSEVFMKTWQYLTTAHTSRVESVSGLLYAIARTTIVDLYRKRSKRREAPIDEAVQVAGNSREQKTIETHIAYQELLKKIRQLKQEYQEVILLKYIEEYSTAEIAKILGKKRTAVRVTLHRAMKVLDRKAIEDA
jgi:RNA polymerase sigma-70 factor, ECF subfamily